MANWLGRQIKGYVDSQIPSWGNLVNNPMSGYRVVIRQVELPDLNTNYIFVGEGCVVQPADQTDPFTVKTKYVET